MDIHQGLILRRRCRMQTTERGTRWPTPRHQQPQDPRARTIPTHTPQGTDTLQGVIPRMRRLLDITRRRRLRLLRVGTLLVVDTRVLQLRGMVRDEWVSLWDVFGICGVWRCGGEVTLDPVLNMI